MAKPMMIGHVPTDEELEEYRLRKEAEERRGAEPLTMVSERDLLDIRNWALSSEAAKLLGISVAMFQLLKRENRLQGIRVTTFNRRQRFFIPDVLARFKLTMRVL